MDKKTDMLINNGYDWYVVADTSGGLELRHRSSLSAILDCGQDPANFGITSIDQCWSGEDLS